MRNRFKTKFTVNEATGCWDWQAAKYPSGYGQVWNGEQPEQAHRVSWRLHCGDIPARLRIRHSCCNRGCVNPGHMHLVARPRKLSAAAEDPAPCSHQPDSAAVPQ